MTRKKFPCKYLTGMLWTCQCLAMPSTESHQPDQAEIARRITEAKARFDAGTTDGLWPDTDDEPDADELYPR